MSPEKIRDVLPWVALALQLAAWAGLCRYVWTTRRDLSLLRRALERQKLAHLRVVDVVHEIDLRVPKKRAGWGTMLNDAETRVRGGAETFPELALRPPPPPRELRDDGAGDS
jgi:hypothetical protein